MTRRYRPVEAFAIRLIAACLVLSWLAAYGASTVIRGRA